MKETSTCRDIPLARNKIAVVLAEKTGHQAVSNRFRVKSSMSVMILSSGIKKAGARYGSSFVRQH
jgi:hypothetical protein